MIIDGRAVAQERIEKMAAFVRERAIVPTLVALTAEPTVPTQQFLKIKKRVAEQIGIVMSVVEVAVEEGDVGALESLREAVHSSQGVVIQLPFPPSFHTEELLAFLPASHDPDGIGASATAMAHLGTAQVMPPVAAALRCLCAQYAIPLSGRRAVVVGQGRLVGVPAALWLESAGAEVVRLTRESERLDAEIASADILVLGAGVPGLVRPDMIQEGVVLFDAGTSEEGGKVVGDADPLCAQKASFFTPVPGGIGPVAVAELFGNLLRLQFDYQE